MKFFFTTSLLLYVFLSISCNKEDHYTDALTPEQALQSFQLHDDFTIEVFAAEPYVMDPVSMIFDEQGNIYVVEMPDYPYKPKEGEGKGRIKLLIDHDHDGRIDEAKIFADTLSEATSILPWQGGLLVTSAPHIYYLKDTDGDFKADEKEILFSGFFENNSEAQITNLSFSVDNWVYAANHGQAGEVSYSRKPNMPPLAMQGGDFRFRLDKDTFALATGPAQFGLAINDWGHRFMTQNTIHIRHAVIPKRYMDRNTYMPTASAILNISDHDLRMFQETPPPYWRAERTRRRQQQYDEQGLDRVEYAEDYFTGSSGGTVYAGDAFPEEFYGNVFTGDVAGNLVHRDVLTLTNESPAYIAKRHESEQEKEFLSSTDPWFRPANFTLGPDGYLYVIDMYRQHIETPLSIPEDLKADMDFMNGSEMGRIYRIRPVNADAKEKIIPDMSTMSAQQLVDLLAHPNQWWRLQAQRLLLERQDESVVPEVASMFSQHADPRVRLHAFYVLEGLNKLDEDMLKQAMMDAHPAVREHGIILAERYPDMLSSVIECLKDSSARVAFQACLSLGEYEDDETVRAMAEVISQKGEDSWFQKAVLSSEAGSSFDLLLSLATEHTFFQEAADWKQSFLADIAYVIGGRHQQKEILTYLNWLENMEANWKRAGVEGLLKGLKKSEDSAFVEGMEINEDKNATEVIEELTNHFIQSI
ncbi:PVC-type heme-binding CxxCH protein [Catalinimonas sp. 4WD22]|uniref:PVC-type heme-binding CxxCH protein n=1 Tax=Catalinimonas locisalis TaxID=3133978 RepID=UPI003100D2DD